MEKSCHDIPLVTDQFEKGDQSPDRIKGAICHDRRVDGIVIESLLLSIAAYTPTCLVNDRLVRWTLFRVNPSSGKDMSI